VTCSVFHPLIRFQVGSMSHSHFYRYSFVMMRQSPSAEGANGTIVPTLNRRGNGTFVD
jgi:hypothetical protein